MTPPPSPGGLSTSKRLKEYVRRTWRGLRKNAASRDITSIRTVQPGPANTPTESRRLSAPPVMSTNMTPSSMNTITTPAVMFRTYTTTAIMGQPVVEINPQPANQIQTRQDRTRAVFAKYGLTLENYEGMNTPPTPVERVEKPIRMRVRRQCHRCQTYFGFGTTCSNCQHVRCQQCPQYPPRKSKPENEARALKPADKREGTGSGLATTDEIGTEDRPETNFVTIFQSPGASLYRKNTLRLVRRVCHRCGENFGRDTATCYRCQHVRCDNCSEGFPEIDRDHTDLLVRQYKKPRIRIRWTCHSCSNLFQQGSRTCAQCNHDRCATCTRQPPEKPKHTFDADAVRTVEENMRMSSGWSGPIDVEATQNPH